jgi:gliding motility-associated-like protein
MKKLIGTIFFVLLFFGGWCQNLVIDPSFENYTVCPMGPGSFPCTNWIQPYPSGGGCSTSDYYNSCCQPGWASVPSNFIGNEPALTGNGYAGVMLYSGYAMMPCMIMPGSSNYREYIEGSLSSPLVAGQTYSVSMNVSLPEDVKLTCNNIGIYFTNAQLSLPCPAPLASTVLPYVPQLQYAGPPITNTSGWTLIQWSYTAVGGEQYFTIGNFFDDANTTGGCANAASQNFFAYYYIDDVSVALANPPTGLNAAVTPTAALCNGQCNGSAIASPFNGTAPYTYVWSPGGQTTAMATGLCAGIYSVLVTDALNAIIISSVTITQPAVITASTTVTPAPCGTNSGTASASASGGTPSFTYSWSNGQTGTSVSGLAAGNYVLTVSDSNGCFVSSPVTIANLNGPSVVVVSSNASCSGVSNGTAAAASSGGTVPYIYSWSNGQTTSAVSGLVAGSYSVVVTDANGCTNTVLVTINSGTGPVILISPNVSISAGSSANLSASGGNTYSWYPSSGLSCTSCANPVATPSSDSQYCVVGTDTNGCSDSACVMVFISPESIPCGEFYLPNAFSPNEDGENDVFQSYINPLCITAYQLIIYNRWGEKIFETAKVVEGWNGYFHGTLSDPAVYAYTCIVSFTNGTALETRGNVSLVR